MSDNKIKHKDLVTIHDTNTMDELHIYMVQFNISKHDKEYNKLIIAATKEEAIDVVLNKYKIYEINNHDIRCEQIDIKRGTIFSV